MNFKLMMRKGFGVLLLFTMMLFLLVSVEIVKHILVLIVANNLWVFIWIFILIFTATYGLFLGLMGATLLFGDLS